MTDISLHWGPIREPEEWGSFIADFERQVTEGSGNGSSLSLSLSLSSVRGIWGRDPVLRSLEVTSKKVLEIEHLSPCSGFVRRTWKGFRY